MRSVLLVLLRHSWWLSGFLNHPPCRSPPQKWWLKDNFHALPQLDYMMGAKGLLWPLWERQQAPLILAQPLLRFRFALSSALPMRSWSLWAAQYRSWTVWKLPYIFSMADRCVGGFFLVSEACSLMIQKHKLWWLVPSSAVSCCTVTPAVVIPSWQAEGKPARRGCVSQRTLAVNREGCVWCVIHF